MTLKGMSVTGADRFRDVSELVTGLLRRGRPRSCETQKCRPRERYVDAGLPVVADFLPGAQI